MSTSWTDRHGAERLRRFIALLLATLAFAAAAPARAFVVTQNPDGSFEYFFAAPSLRIESTGDLDLTGLSFIEGVADGFRVGASFGLDWLGGENARLAPSATNWSGLATQPRSLEIVAGGSLLFDTASLSLVGGTISLAAGSYLELGDGSSIDVGNSGGISIGTPDVSLWRPPAGSTRGGTITILPGGDITLIGGPTPIPEPDTVALFLAGLLALTGFARRGAQMAQ